MVFLLQQLTLYIAIWFWCLKNSFVKTKASVLKCQLKGCEFKWLVCLKSKQKNPHFLKSNTFIQKAIFLCGNVGQQWTEGVHFEKWQMYSFYPLSLLYFCSWSSRKHLEVVNLGVLGTAMLLALGAACTGEQYCRSERISDIPIDLQEQTRAY